MKLLKISLLLLLSSAIVYASSISNKELSQLKAFTDIKATITGNQLIGKNLDLYLVKGIDGTGRPFSIVTDKDGKYLVLTDNVFDTVKKAPITIPVDVSGLKGKQLFTYGTGKDEYYVFTDPECPYCHKFEAGWPKVKDKVKFHVFFFNLDFHKNANAMSRWILSAKTDEEKAKRLNAVGNGDKSYQNLKLSKAEEEKLNTMIEKTKSLGKELGVQGTPAVYDSKGNVVNWPTIIQ